MNNWLCGICQSKSTVSKGLTLPQHEADYIVVENLNLYEMSFQEIMKSRLSE